MNYYCLICREFQRKDPEEIRQHLKEAHNIITDEDKIEHIGAQC